MNFPSLFIRFFGLSGSYSETVGQVKLRRVSEGPPLQANINFKPRGTAGWKSNAHKVDGSIVSEDEVSMRFRGEQSKRDGGFSDGKEGDFGTVLATCGAKESADESCDATSQQVYG